MEKKKKDICAPIGKKGGVYFKLVNDLVIFPFVFRITLLRTVHPVSAQASCGRSSGSEIRGKLHCWRKVNRRVSWEHSLGCGPHGEVPKDQRTEDRGLGWKRRASRGSEEETGKRLRQLFMAQRRSYFVRKALSILTFIAAAQEPACWLARQAGGT